MNLLGAWSGQLTPELVDNATLGVSELAECSSLVKALSCLSLR
jgi:hypothetical protein